MATITIFALSLLITTTLIGVKAIEIRYKRKNFLLEILSRFDSKSNDLVSSLKFRGLQIVQSGKYIIFVELKNICSNFLRKAEEKVLNEYKAKQDTIIMGRKNITNKGSVSFYLKKITENKGIEKKGKIEESF